MKIKFCSTGSEFDVSGIRSFRSGIPGEVFLEVRLSRLLFSSDRDMDVIGEVSCDVSFWALIGGECEKFYVRKYALGENGVVFYLFSYNTVSLERADDLRRELERSASSYWCELHPPK